MSLSWVLLGAVVLGGAYLLYKIYESSKKVYIKTEKVDNLTMEKVLQWFRSDDVKSEALKNPNLVSAMLRGKEVENYVENFEKGKQDKTILVGLFDKSKNEFVKAQIFICESIDQEILDLFGSKELVLLK